MKKNLGNTDRVIRVAGSLLLIYIGFFNNPIVSSGSFKVIIGIFGVIVLISAIVGNCPMYAIADIDTTRKG